MGQAFARSNYWNYHSYYCDVCLLPHQFLLHPRGYLFVRNIYETNFSAAAEFMRAWKLSGVFYFYSNR